MKILKKTYAVKAVQELSDIVKKRQEQIGGQKQQIDRLLSIILNLSFLKTKFKILFFFFWKNRVDFSYPFKKTDKILFFYFESLVKV